MSITAPVVEEADTWNGIPNPVNPHPVYQGGKCPECDAPRGHANPWCTSYDIANGPC